MATEDEKEEKRRTREKGQRQEENERYVQLEEERRNEDGNWEDVGEARGKREKEEAPTRRPSRCRGC